MASPTPSQHQGKPVHQTQQTQTQQTLVQQAKQMPRPVQQQHPMPLTHPYPHGAAGTPYTTPPTAPFVPRRDPLAAPDGSTPADRRLLAITSAAIILPILCDRLVFAWSDANTYTPWFDGFWLAVIATVTVLFFRTAHRSLMWCFTTLATAMLCAYAIAMHAAGKIDDSWATTTFLAVPCLTMMSLQLSDGRFNSHHPWLTVKRWMLGWISPFTKLNAVGSTLSHAQHAIHAFSSKNDDNTTPSDNDSTRSELHAGQMTTARRILLIIVVAVPLLVALTALLASSDLVFNYALRRMIGSIDISEFVRHMLIIVFLFPFCLSILAQTDEIMGETENRYSGIPTIRSAMKNAGLPQPVFVNNSGVFKAILYNEIVSEKGNSDLASRILDFCSVPRSRRELEEKFKEEITIAYLMSKHMKPLIAENKIALTKPESPKSKDQKYFTIK